MHRREFLMRSTLAATGAATANVASAAGSGRFPGPLLRHFGFTALFDCA
jgi:hypothetical protein